MKKILLTNDDGVRAPGILAMAQALRKANFDVTILGPDTNWSASGHKKTMNKPLRINKVQLADGSWAFATDGAPSDCVALGLMGALDMEFDFIVSGINNNANIGSDVSYSGTVAAVLEAGIMGKPGFAVSVDAPEYNDGNLDYLSTASKAMEIIIKLLEMPMEDQDMNVWNINLPYFPDGSYKGVQFTRLGKRYYHDFLLRREDPFGRPYFWIGGEQPTGLMEDHTDYGALKTGFVSVTPLHIDSTNYAVLEKLEKNLD